MAVLCWVKTWVEEASEAGLLAAFLLEEVALEMEKVPVSHAQWLEVFPLQLPECPLSALWVRLSLSLCWVLLVSELRWVQLVSELHWVQLVSEQVVLVFQKVGVELEWVLASLPHLWGWGLA